MVEGRRRVYQTFGGPVPIAPLCVCGLYRRWLAGVKINQPSFTYTSSLLLLCCGVVMHICESNRSSQALRKFPFLLCRSLHCAAVSCHMERTEDTQPEPEPAGSAEQQQPRATRGGCWLVLPSILSTLGHLIFVGMLVSARAALPVPAAL